MNIIYTALDRAATAIQLCYLYQLSLEGLRCDASLTHLPIYSRYKPIADPNLLSNMYPQFHNNALCSSLLLFSGLANAAMGPAFSTGPVADNSWIRETNATLVLPRAPNGSSGDASLWVGMGTSNGDLIQSIADNWQSDSWSLYAYTLLSTSATTQMPVQGDSTIAEPGDRVTFHCELPYFGFKIMSTSLIVDCRQV